MHASGQAAFIEFNHEVVQQGRQQWQAGEHPVGIWQEGALVCTAQGEQHASAAQLRPEGLQVQPDRFLHSIVVQYSHRNVSRMQQGISC